MEKVLLFVIGFLAFAILGISVTGVALASIDFAHQIFNVKSICFMVFGLLGIIISPFGPFVNIYLS